MNYTQLMQMRMDHDSMVSTVQSFEELPIEDSPEARENVAIDCYTMREAVLDVRSWMGDFAPATPTILYLHEICCRLVPFYTGPDFPAEEQIIESADVATFMAIRNHALYSALIDPLEAISARLCLLQDRGSVWLDNRLPSIAMAYPVPPLTQEIPENEISPDFRRPQKPIRLPKNPDVIDLIKRLAEETPKGRKQIEIAREFVAGTNKNPDDLLRQCRDKRYKNLWKESGKPISPSGEQAS